MAPPKSPDFVLLERLSSVYGALGFESQNQVVTRAKELGLAGFINQPLVSDWLLAVRNKDFDRRLKPEKRTALTTLVDALEDDVAGHHDETVRTAGVIVVEIRAKLDELEMVLASPGGGGIALRAVNARDTMRKARRANEEEERRQRAE
jgi:hypothetical protein